MERLRRPVAACVLTLAALSPAAASGAGGSVAVQAKLLFKIATYDGNLPEGVLRVGVVHPASDKGADEALGAFAPLAAMKVNGHPIEIVAVPFSSAADVAQAAARLGLYGVFVMASTPVAVVSAVRALAKERQLFTFAQDPEHVKLGLVAGIEESEGKRTILLNVPAAIEAGRKYDSGFLEVCKVIQ